MKKIALGLVSVLGVSACTSGPAIVAERPMNLTRDQLESIEYAVMMDLRDPRDPYFKNIRAKEVKLADGTETVMFCGEVNAHADGGGYGGFSWFYGNVDMAQRVPIIKYRDNSYKNDSDALLAQKFCSKF